MTSTANAPLPRRIAGIDLANPEFRVLDEDRCWQLASTAGRGRLAIRGYNEVDIFPVNFLVKDRNIFFRTAPGSKLMDLHRWPVVAFECDGRDGSVWWSVVVRGAATRMGTDREIVESGVMTLSSFAPGDKFNYVCISSNSISGREFASIRPQ